MFIFLDLGGIMPFFMENDGSTFVILWALEMELTTDEG
jgi:hypothetical protein